MASTQFMATPFESSGVAQYEPGLCYIICNAPRLFEAHLKWYRRPISTTIKHHFTFLGLSLITNINNWICAIILEVNHGQIGMRRLELLL